MKSVLRKRIERMSSNDLIEAMYCDVLTGVWNRRAFCELLEHKLGDNPRLFVAIIDLDSLKWLNDTLGHRSGDEALKEVADHIAKTFPGRCFRLAGDEFLTYAGSEAELRAALHHEGRIYSFGIGSTLEEADASLKCDKEARETFGLRAGRGDPPPWSSERFFVD